MENLGGDGTWQIAEPTAAARHFFKPKIKQLESNSNGKGIKSNILVIDVGAGITDVSVVSINVMKNQNDKDNDVKNNDIVTISIPAAFNAQQRKKSIKNNSMKFIIKS